MWRRISRSRRGKANLSVQTARKCGGLSARTQLRTVRWQGSHTSRSSTRRLRWRSCCRYHRAMWVLQCKRVMSMKPSQNHLLHLRGRQPTVTGRRSLHFARRSRGSRRHSHSSSTKLKRSHRRLFKGRQSCNPRRRTKINYFW